jgi:hypothetical protein
LELAAVGFARLGAALVANVREDAPPKARLASIGRAYVTFTRPNQGLFLLMFRSDRLDFSRPALRATAGTAFGVLAHAAGGQPQVRSDARLTPSQTAKITAAWSLVHGFAMLMLDDRLKLLVAQMPDGTAAILRTPWAQQAPRMAPLHPKLAEIVCRPAARAGNENGTLHLLRPTAL